MLYGCTYTPISPTKALSILLHRNYYMRSTKRNIGWGVTTLTHLLLICSETILITYDETYLAFKKLFLRTHFMKSEAADSDKKIF